MPTIAVKCPYCGAAARLDFDQAAHGCELLWSESLHCPACGARMEADGGEDMPEARRAVLLAEEGRWSVVVQDRPTVGLLKAARECLALSVAEMPALKARLPGVLATGTRCEMEVLANRLRRAAGVEAPVTVTAAEP